LRHCGQRLAAELDDDLHQAFAARNGIVLK
jgi:hypothetical protein